MKFTKLTPIAGYKVQKKSSVDQIDMIFTAYLDDKMFLLKRIIFSDNFYVYPVNKYMTKVPNGKIRYAFFRNKISDNIYLELVGEPIKINDTDYQRFTADLKDKDIVKYKDNEIFA